jgi:hypothetical protein
MKAIPQIVIFTASIVGLGSAMAGDEVDLPGVKGPLWKAVGVDSALVVGADVAAESKELLYLLVRDTKSEKPPMTRKFPSATKELTIAVKFQKKPFGKSIVIDVFNKDGKVVMGGGLVLQSEDRLSGAYAIKVGQSPKAGAFQDGAYQARIRLDDTIAAVINWEIGEPTK